MIRTLCNIFALATLGVAFSCASFGTSPHQNDIDKYEKSKNYKDGEFQNEIETEKLTINQFSLMMKFFFGGEEKSEPEKPIEIVSLNAKSYHKPPLSGLWVTWLGHSSMILEIDGKTILIDPVFSERTSPYQWVGPKRFHEVPIRVEDLPELDAVVISHDHYDHLDMNTIKQLNAKTPRFIVPLAVSAHLLGWGISKEKITETDWYESVMVDDLKLVCTPARHFSGRGIFDENKTLWSSWVFIGKKNRAFYSGDTGPMPSFKKIGDTYGPFDLTMIQQGAYGQYWPYIHMTPDEAAIAHKDLRGQVMLPVHWGTFDLAMHDWDEPYKLAQVAARKHKVTIVQPRPGEMFEPVDAGKIKPAPIVSHFDVERQ